MSYIIGIDPTIGAFGDETHEDNVHPYPAEQVNKISSDIILSRNNWFYLSYVDQPLGITANVTFNSLDCATFFSTSINANSVYPVAPSTTLSINGTIFHPTEVYLPDSGYLYVDRLDVKSLTEIQIYTEAKFWNGIQVIRIVPFFGVPVSVFSDMIIDESSLTVGHILKTNIISPKSSNTITFSNGYPIFTQGIRTTSITAINTDITVNSLLKCNEFESSTVRCDSIRSNTTSNVTITDELVISSDTSPLFSVLETTTGTEFNLYTIDGRITLEAQDTPDLRSTQYLSLNPKASQYSQMIFFDTCRPLTSCIFGIYRGDGTTNRSHQLVTKGDSGVPKDSYLCVDEGNLGIGTRTPATKLDVIGSIFSQGLTVSTDTKKLRLTTNVDSSFIQAGVDSSDANARLVISRNGTTSNTIANFDVYSGYNHFRSLETKLYDITTPAFSVSLLHPYNLTNNRTITFPDASIDLSYIAAPNNPRYVWCTKGVLDAKTNISDSPPTFTSAPGLPYNYFQFEPGERCRFFFECPTNIDTSSPYYVKIIWIIDDLVTSYQNYTVSLTFVNVGRPIEAPYNTVVPIFNNGLDSSTAMRQAVVASSTYGTTNPILGAMCFFERTDTEVSDSVNIVAVSIGFPTIGQNEYIP